MFLSVRVANAFSRLIQKRPGGPVILLDQWRRKGEEERSEKREKRKEREEIVGSSHYLANICGLF
jgi:hypothetical protein